MSTIPSPATLDNNGTNAGLGGELLWGQYNPSSKRVETEQDQEMDLDRNW
jgi:hypothetical protein